MTMGTMVLPIAQVELVAGDAPAALKIVEDSLVWIRERGELVWESEALRLRGDCELASGDVAGAEKSYRTAIEVARNQGALLFELRAACALCRLYEAQGREAEGRNMLQPVFDVMTEGRESADLREAAELLGIQR